MHYFINKSKKAHHVCVVLFSLFLISCGGGSTGSSSDEETIDVDIFQPIYTDNELADLTRNILNSTSSQGELTEISIENTPQILYLFEKIFAEINIMNKELRKRPLETTPAVDTMDYWENLRDNEDAFVYEKNCEGSGDTKVDYLKSYRGLFLSYDKCLISNSLYTGIRGVRVVDEDDEYLTIERLFNNLSVTDYETGDLQKTTAGSLLFVISKTKGSVVEVTGSLAVDFPSYGLVTLNNLKLVTQEWSSSNYATFPYYTQLNTLEGRLDIEGLGAVNFTTVYDYDDGLIDPAFRIKFSGTTQHSAHFDIAASSGIGTYYTFGIDNDGDGLNDKAATFLRSRYSESITMYEDLDLSNNTINPVTMDDVSYSAGYLYTTGYVEQDIKFNVSHVFRGMSGKLFTYDVNIYPVWAKQPKSYFAGAYEYLEKNIESEYSYKQIEPGIFLFKALTPFTAAKYEAEIVPIDVEGDVIGDSIVVRIEVDNDNDHDNVSDENDLDDDNDGVSDSVDAFFLDPLEQYDNDGDRIGDNADTDDDNDGVLDANDLAPFDSLCSSELQLVDGECAFRNIPYFGFISNNGIYYYYYTSQAGLMRWDLATEDFLLPIIINRDGLFSSAEFSLTDEGTSKLFVAEQNRLYQTYRESGIISMIDFSEPELKEIIYHIDNNESLGEIYDYTDSAIVYREDPSVVNSKPEDLVTGITTTSINYKLINLLGEIVDERTHEYIAYNDLQKYTRFDSAPYCPFGFTFNNDTLKFYDMQLDYNWPENPCYWKEDEISDYYIFASPDNSRAFSSTLGSKLMDGVGNELEANFDITSFNRNNLVWNTDVFYLLNNDNVVKRYNYNGELLDQMTIAAEGHLTSVTLKGHDGEHVVIKIQSRGDNEYTRLYSYKVDKE